MKEQIMTDKERTALQLARVNRVIDRVMPSPSWKVKDVAAYFGVRVQVVYKWVYRELIPHHRTPGGGLRFVEAEVKAAQVKREGA